MAMASCIGMVAAPTEVFQSMSACHHKCLSVVETHTFRPNHFVSVSMTRGSVIENLRIQNWPTHLFSISSSKDLTLRNLILDNSAGDVPNNRSNGQGAGHNTDGIGVSTSSNILITGNEVYNQDDCVAVTSGNNITVSDMYCHGSHGLSIGSVGGKSDNNVTNVLVNSPVSVVSSLN